MGYTGLFPDDVRELLPAFEKNPGNGDDAIVYVKFFQPWGHWTWYVTEGEPTIGIDAEGEEFEVDYKFFGFVVGDFPEWGYFSLNELQSLHGPYGLKIERDMWWDPTPMKECKGYTS